MQNILVQYNNNIPDTGITGLVVILFTKQIIRESEERHIITCFPGGIL
jgi:hypothetical protein